MAAEKNFFARSFDALVAGRQRSEQLYVARSERDYAKLNGKLMKR